MQPTKISLARMNYSQHLCRIWTQLSFAIITIFVYIGYLTETPILNMINQHSQVNLFHKYCILTQIALRFVPVASAAVRVFCAVDIDWNLLKCCLFDSKVC